MKKHVHCPYDTPIKNMKERVVNQQRALWLNKPGVRQMRADRMNAKRAAEETKNRLAQAKDEQKVSKAAEMAKNKPSRKPFNRIRNLCQGFHLTEQNSRTGSVAYYCKHPYHGLERAPRVGFGAPLAIRAGVAMISLATRSSRSTTSHNVK